MNIPDFTGFSRDELIDLLTRKEADHQILLKDLERYKEIYNNHCTDCKHNPLR